MVLKNNRVLYVKLPCPSVPTSYSKVLADERIVPGVAWPERGIEGFDRRASRVRCYASKEEWSMVPSRPRPALLRVQPGYPAGYPMWCWNPLEAVMNLLRSGLLMRKTGDWQRIEPRE